MLSALAHLRLPHVIGRLEEQFGAPDTRPRYLRITDRGELSTLSHRRGSSVRVAGDDVTSAAGAVRAARSEKYLWPYLEPQPVPQLDWLEVSSAKHAAYTENLYMRAHLLPSTLIRELVPRPEPRVTLPATVSQPCCGAVRRGAARCVNSNLCRGCDYLRHVVVHPQASPRAQRRRKASKAAGQHDQPSGE